MPPLNLEELRQQIDTFDDIIILLLAKRDEAVKQVARYKQKHGLSLRQPQREAQVIKPCCQLAQERGVDPDFADFVEKLFRLIMEEGLNQEQKLTTK